LDSLVFTNRTEKRCIVWIPVSEKNAGDTESF